MYLFIKKLIELPRYIKIVIQFIVDIFLIIFAYYLSLLIRYESNYFFNIENIFTPLVIFLPIAVIFLIFNNFYSYWLRYASSEIILKISLLSLFAFVFMIIMDEVFNFSLLKSVSIMFSILVFILILINKFFLKLIFIIINSDLKENSLIYGVGHENLSSLYNFRYSNFKIIGFINPEMKKIKNIAGHKVINILEINDFIKKNNVKNVLINSNKLPNIKLLEALSNSGISIIKFDNNFGINNNFEFNKISLDDLIGRFEINKSYFEDVKFIKNKVILITGAGGSIGSALFEELLTIRQKEFYALTIMNMQFISLDKEQKII